MEINETNIAKLEDLFEKQNLAEFFLLASDMIHGVRLQPGLVDALEEKSRNYEMLIQCYVEDMPDPQRLKILGEIRSFLWRLLNILKLYSIILGDVTLNTIYTKVQNVDLMEVGDLLRKKPDDQETRAVAFSVILTSFLWDEKAFAYYRSLVLDEQTDKKAAEMMVSAMMLSCLCVPDYWKIHCMMEIYLNTEVGRVHETALICWVFAAAFANVDEMPALHDDIQNACADASVLAELLQMQKQVFLCMDAEQDAANITKNIMSNIPFADYMRGKATDFEDFSMDDLFLGDEEEERQDKFEKSVMDMVSKQKAGCDIYYDGFSKMKKFDFFRTLSNWFTPYYATHPMLKKLRDILGNDNLVTDLECTDQFCDSDKYSFCFVLERTGGSKLSILEDLLGGGLMRKALDGKDPELDNDVVRRMLLQNLFRFFKLSLYHKPFQDVFGDSLSSPGFFLGKSQFRFNKLMDELAAKVCHYLCKHKNFKYLGAFLNPTPETQEDFFLSALYNMYSKRDFLKASTYLSQVRAEGNAALPVRKAMAKCYFELGKFDLALKQYRAIDQLKPSMGNSFKMAYCMMELEQVEDALSILYELDYKNPNNPDLIRALEWGNILRGDFDKANECYDKLVGCFEKDPSLCIPEDSYNNGLIAWLNGSIKEACFWLITYMKHGKLTVDQLKEKFKQDGKLFRRAGIDELEYALMADSVAICANQIDDAYAGEQESEQ